MKKLFRIVVAMTSTLLGVLLGIAAQAFFLTFSTGLHVERFSKFQLLLEVLYLFVCGGIGFIIYYITSDDD